MILAATRDAHDWWKVWGTSNHSWFTGGNGTSKTSFDTPAIPTMMKFMCSVNRHLNTGLPYAGEVFPTIHFGSFGFFFEKLPVLNSWQMKLLATCSPSSWRAIKQASLVAFWKKKKTTGCDEARNCAIPSSTELQRNDSALWKAEFVQFQRLPVRARQGMRLKTQMSNLFAHDIAGDALAWNAIGKARGVQCILMHQLNERRGIALDNQTCCALDKPSWCQFCKKKCVAHGKHNISRPGCLLQDGRSLCLSFHGANLICNKMLPVPPLEYHDGDHSLATKCTPGFLRSIRMETVWLVRNDDQLMHEP